MTGYLKRFYSAIFPKTEQVASDPKGSAIRVRVVLKEQNCSSGGGSVLIFLSSPAPVLGLPLTDIFGQPYFRCLAKKFSGGKSGNHNYGLGGNRV